MLRNAVLLAAAATVSAKTERVEIPMRDGFKLSTYINCPDTGAAKKTAIFDTSTYGHWATENLADAFSEALGDDFCSVRQDMRGTWLSHHGGQDFTLWHSQGNDSFDTFKWLSEQDWSNGEVYQTGISADGIGAIMSWKDSPPQLKKQFVVWASIDSHQTPYDGGAFREALIEGWLKSTFPDQYQGLINTTEQNEAPGPWWSPVNMTQKCDSMYFPSVLLSGWYDIFQQGNLAAYECYRNKGYDSRLVVQACGHCMGGGCPFYLIEDRKTDIAFIMALDMFAGRSPPSEIRNITFYVMGAGDKSGDYVDPLAPGNFWTSVDEWPVFSPNKYYMHKDMSLSRTPPTSDDKLSYVFKPQDAVPTIGGNNLMIMCGARDQRPSENRTDVLTFTTQVLKEDLILTGPLVVTLHVESSAVDTDFTAKLTDVYPDGRSMLINDGITRLRWRQGVFGGNQPQLITPGKIYEIEISMWNTSFIFARGHSLRVSVSSSNNPRFMPNRNNGKSISEGGPFVNATNTVHLSEQYPSYITLPVVKKEQLPKVSWNLIDEWLDNRPPAYRTAHDLYLKHKEEVARRMFEQS
eukprot:TRINITY_DN1269_c0_g3_i1.p1 TRINITY_DN1269_c0_g3~~TRINITY_DN1269_c0_g3_i1.p1  ORF type:complete len:578 (+),score=128.59 TRINITY_DN1269_c0_g3_i1:44-1777(+)